MPFAEVARAGLRRASTACIVGLVLALSACTTREPPAQPGSASAPPSAARPSESGRDAAHARQGAAKAIKLGPPRTPRSWAEARRQAAQRLVAANPEGSYMGKPPFMLLAIPVMTIELNADGSVRHVSVMRKPSQAHDTVELATQAIHRAAPFGDVSRLPKPWKFNETFLFKADRKFKPMTLDQPGS